jgi:hypothetical protein
MGDLQRKRRHIASLKSGRGKEVDIQLYRLRIVFRDARAHATRQTHEKLCVTYVRVYRFLNFFVSFKYITLYRILAFKC